MNKKRIISLLLLAGVLGVLVYLQVRAWRKFDWTKFAEQTGRIRWEFVVVAILLIYLTYFLRAVRWKIFLRPVCNARLSSLLPTQYIGFTGLALLGRPGEFIRPYLIAKKEGLTVSSQIGVWTVERIFDIGAFTVLMLFNIFFSGNLRGVRYYAEFRDAGFVLLGIVGALALVAWAMKRRGPAIAGWLDRNLGRISRRLGHQVAHRAAAFSEGLNTIHDTRSFIQLVAVSIAIWWIIALAYREVAHAYHGHLGHMTISHVMLLMGSSMVGSIVQLPAIGGGSQFAVILALQNIFDVSPEIAVSCGVLLWLVTFMAVIPAGLALARQEHVSLRRITRESEQAEEAPAAVEPTSPPATY